MCSMFFMRQMARAAYANLNYLSAQASKFTVSPV